MGMTITEKILAAHAGVERVTAGDLINARIDIVMGHDLSTPAAIHEMERIGADRVFDREKIVLVPDHFTPNKDIKSAESCKRMKEFAKRHGSPITMKSVRWELPMPSFLRRELSYPEM